MKAYERAAHIHSLSLTVWSCTVQTLCDIEKIIAFCVVFGRELLCAHNYAATDDEYLCSCCATDRILDQKEWRSEAGKGGRGPKRYARKSSRSRLFYRRAKSLSFFRAAINRRALRAIKRRRDAQHLDRGSARTAGRNKREWARRRRVILRNLERCCKRQKFAIYTKCR